MLYKMHLCREELAVIDEAIKEHIALMDIDTPHEVEENVAEKIRLLKDYVELGAQVQEVLAAKNNAKIAYKNFTFNGIKPPQPFEIDEPLL